MKFSSKEDVDAPIDDVFATLADFTAHERSAIRRGIKVRRADPTAAIGVGVCWDVEFAMRGRQRELKLTLAEFDPPVSMRVETEGQGLFCTLTLDLLALSQRRTRMAIALDIKPRNLSARLFIQSLRLGKSNLTKRFKLRVAEYAKSVEDRHQRGI